MIDLPAPVSPVSTVRPGPKARSRLSIKTTSRMASPISMRAGRSPQTRRRSTEPSRRALEPEGVPVVLLLLFRRRRVLLVVGGCSGVGLRLRRGRSVGRRLSGGRGARLRLRRSSVGLRLRGQGCGGRGRRRLVGGRNWPEEALGVVQEAAAAVLGFDRGPQAL